MKHFRESASPRNSWTQIENGVSFQKEICGESAGWTFDEWRAGVTITLCDENHEQPAGFLPSWVTCCNNKKKTVKTQRHYLPQP